MSDAHPPSRPSLKQVALLLSLLTLVIVRPFLGDSLLGLDLVKLCLGIALVAGVLCTARTRRDWILLPGAALLAAAALTQPFTDNETIREITSLLTLLVFFGLVGLQMVKILLRPTRGVSADTVLAASTTYLVLGIAWALGFSLLEYLEPGSFAFPEEVDVRSEHLARLFGFSFTTLTTLGYGNIAPASAKADALANLEAMAGQAYLAIIVARLVGLHMTESIANDQAGDAKNR